MLSSQEFTYSENVINWTASYRADSTVVTPYAKFVPYAALPSTALKPPVHPGSRRKQSKSGPSTMPVRRNYAAGKSKMVAWFVSNCGALNARMEYVQELSEHVPVDIYGACGALECVRGSANCTAMLNRDYKFYLSFENSNCEHYVTEKFFENGLG